jgi:hypothetical protein
MANPNRQWPNNINPTSRIRVPYVEYTDAYGKLRPARISWRRKTYDLYRQYQDRNHHGMTLVTPARTRDKDCYAMLPACNGTIGGVDYTFRVVPSGYRWCGMCLQWIPSNEWTVHKDHVTVLTFFGKQHRYVET